MHQLHQITKRSTLILDMQMFEWNQKNLSFSSTMILSVSGTFLCLLRMLTTNLFFFIFICHMFPSTSTSTPIVNFLHSFVILVDRKSIHSDLAFLSICPMCTVNPHFFNCQACCFTSCYCTSSWIKDKGTIICTCWHIY